MRNYYSKDITGEKFGRLTAKFPTEKRYWGSITWHCQCDCGNTAEVALRGLTNNGAKSCGCLVIERSERKTKNLIGQTFGRLRVIKKSTKRSKNHGAIWSCVCTCGNKTEVLGGNLRRGLTSSCGCIIREKTRELGKQSSERTLAYHRTITMDKEALPTNKTTGIRNISSAGNGYRVDLKREGKKYRQYFPSFQEALGAKEEALEQFKNGNPNWYAKQSR